MFTQTPLRSLVDLLTGPHGVDRYTELVSPTWTRDEARAEVVSVTRQTPRSVTLTLRPNRAFTGFAAGQHINLSVEIDGRRVTRPYSPASSQHRRDGLVELTVGLHDGGLVSTFLRSAARPGLVVGLDGVGGDFVLPADRPARIVLVSGGSGITPVLSMLRTLRDEAYAGSVTHIHYARTAADVPYREELERVCLTREGDARFGPGSVDTAGAEVFVCGPPSLVDAVHEHCENVHSESFVPPVFVIPANPSGGRVAFAGSGVETTDDGRSLLEQALAAGLAPEHGCRMGICRSCTCRKTSGAVRNLITGAVSTAGEEDVQICVSVPLGDVELAI
ncbi:MAG: stearoyl-CoA 9-desaturase oxidoreductase [Solirubrobacteraceae bacterium]|jgi:ferredoxin-NADP reductase|nr:stearoyl-CoA 9-desaturase oxidoreductase [Solirubrobacteraceae bacterium]